jgi:hypothetical protein
MPPTPMLLRQPDANAECNARHQARAVIILKPIPLTFVALPDAGPDQTILQDDVANLTAVGAGTWSQIGNVPLGTIIATPAALKHHS